MSEIDDIISEMTTCEKRIMVIIGGINASPNKNFKRQTVKKKASDEEIPHVDDAIRKFFQLGLLRMYRAPDNLAATKLGFNVAQRLVEERLKEKYRGIRIIRR
jgi:cobalamin-dependent methionine synthase I